jgi:hypothetical protein
MSEQQHLIMTAVQVLDLLRDPHTPLEVDTKEAALTIIKSYLTQGR